MKEVMKNAPTIFVIMVILFFGGFLIGALSQKEEIPKEAIQLYETIEEICIENDLYPEFEAAEGANGNLVFNIVCRER